MRGAAIHHDAVTHVDCSKVSGQRATRATVAVRTYGGQVGKNDACKIGHRPVAIERSFNRRASESVGEVQISGDEDPTALARRWRMHARSLDQGISHRKLRRPPIRLVCALASI